LSALENGRVVAINHYSPFSAKDGKAIIAASIYNPDTGKWSPEVEVAMGHTTHRLRGVAEFDPGSKRLHLLYPDEQGDIRHKILSAPYGPDNWSPKAGEDILGELVVKGTDDDLTIALDYSRSPATITLVYRKDGMVYRKNYDGEKWLNNDTPLAHVTEHSAELSLNVDSSNKLGLLFRRAQGRRYGLRQPRFLSAIGIMQLNAIPVFADVNPDTIMIDAGTIEPLITERTKVLLPVHLLGCPTDMMGIMRLADKYNLKVLEDCAQSWLAEGLGTKWRGEAAFQGKLVGTIGHAGAFSINESKHISAGEGGILITNDEKVGHYADLFVDKSYNRSGEGPVDPVMPALNYRLSEVNAVLAIEQLKRVRQIAEARYRLGEELAAGIEDLSGIKLLRPPPHSKSSYWGGVLLIDRDEACVDGLEFAKALAAEGIRAGAPALRNVLNWPLFQKLNQAPQAFPTYCPPSLEKGQFEPASCPNAIETAHRSVRVHLDEFTTAEDIRNTVRAIRKVVHWYRERGDR